MQVICGFLISKCVVISSKKTYLERRCMTRGRTLSAVGIVSEARDFGNQPMTMQGTKNSDSCLFKRAAVTPDWEIADPGPAGRTRVRRRDEIEDSVENS